MKPNGPMQKAQALLTRGSIMGAERQFRLASLRMSSEAFQMLGVSLRLMGEEHYPEAKEALLKAIEIAPNLFQSGKADRDLGELLWHMGEVAEAKAAFRRSDKKLTASLHEGFSEKDIAQERAATTGFQAYMCFLEGNAEQAKQMLHEAIATLRHLGHRHYELNLRVRLLKMSKVHSERLPIAPRTLWLALRDLHARRCAEVVLLAIGGLPLHQRAEALAAKLRLRRRLLTAVSTVKDTAVLAKSLMGWIKPRK